MPAVRICFHDRSGFAGLANERGYRKLVEVGTDRGAFAHMLLSNWDWIGANGKSQSVLYCVDDYQPYAEMTWDRYADRMQAILLLAPFGDRVRFIQLPSVEAARLVPHLIPAVPLDLVYIDAAHDYENVKRDIQAWWPQVRSGGCLAGHDYVPSAPGVIRAVNELADEHDLTVYRTVDSDEAESWAINKP